MSLSRHTLGEPCRIPSSSYFSFFFKQEQTLLKKKKACGETCPARSYLCVGRAAKCAGAAHAKQNAFFCLMWTPKKMASLASRAKRTTITMTRSIL